jgi:peptidoglycan/xylan/chitin deacetylase (PgdA/CDA1 family)
VLCYHQLRNWTSSDSQYNRTNLICPPARFRAHLDALAEDGWTTISPGKYLRHLTAGGALPPKPIMLSFDDGSAGQAKEGLVQLAERGMIGTFFVMTVEAKRLDPVAPLYTLRRSLVVSTWSGASLVQHPKKQHP